jgi:hypothetical protein
MKQMYRIGAKSERFTPTTNLLDYCPHIYFSYPIIIIIIVVVVVIIIIIIIVIVVVVVVVVLTTTITAE